MTEPSATGPNIETTSEQDLVMSAEERMSAFDAAARRYLQMSGHEFLKKWNSGWFKGKREIASRVDAVSILLPLAE